ncbi:MAG: hypothetical protein K9L17_12055 [Clostridiales bacterium]|nr:hypothetical protein [Clostridiales bacterium]MCF8023417.1 hypothetical protein [Clostridiales bacterium]
MILYTPIQLEQVLQGLDEMKSAKTKQVMISGVPALVQVEEDGSNKLVKLLSTDPEHYMRPELVPGVQVKI